MERWPCAYGQTAILAGSETPLIVSGLVMQFFLFGMWAVLYAYTPELYSTGARDRIGVRVGRGAGGIAAGPVPGGSGAAELGQGGVFTVGAGCFFVAALLVYVLGVETRGISLEELSARQPEPSARAVSVPRTR